MHVRLTIEYDGTGYCGWQSQAEDDTVQARIEAALAQLYGRPIRIKAAGRTDAGVHALAQVAAFEAPRNFEPLELRRALNALLPSDIVVREAAEAAPGFDARRDALVRVYEYRIVNRSLRSAFEYRYAWLVTQPLNFAAMRAAARVFLGEHDFAAFRTLGTETRTSVRKIFSSHWEKTGDVLVYRVEGSSFLRHMVRAMVSAMVEVGRNRLDLEALRSLLAGGIRGATPAAAPACGLFLVEIRYPQSWTYGRL